MAIRLGWDDLLIQNLQPEECMRWMHHWSGWVTGRIHPIYMSKFGDWFLRHPNGATSELSVIEGTVRQVASTPEEFDTFVNQRGWQEEHLLSLFVFALHERNIIPSQGECYGFAPHPALSGKIDLEHVVVTKIGPWQAICAQMFGKPKGQVGS